MYNFQDCGETKKETLSHDDIDAICAIYPKADDPGTCEPGRRARRVLQHLRRAAPLGRARRGRLARCSCAACVVGASPRGRSAKSSDAARALGILGR